MFSREDYLLRQIDETVKAIAKLVALIQSNRIEDAQVTITQNIDLNIQNALLQNDFALLSKTNKQALEFQIELAYQQIIILQIHEDANLKLKAMECLTMIKNYNQLNSLTFNINLFNKINALQTIIKNEE